MKILHVPHDQLSDEMSGALCKLLFACWPKQEFFKTHTWCFSEPEWHLIAEDRGEPVAHVSMLRRTVNAGEQAILVAGLACVCTSPGIRGKGWGLKLVREFDRLCQGDFDAGLGFTGKELLSYYARAGWESYPCQIRDFPGGKFWDACGIWKPYRTPVPKAKEVTLNGARW